MKNINENIKKYRLEKGITQQEIADKLFVTRQCVSRWEQGKSVPDIETLEKLAYILEITVGEVIDDESIKSLTINETIKNHKNKKIIWTSFMISALAVLLTISGYFFINKQLHEDKRIPPVTINHTRGVITEHNLENDTFTFEKDGQTVLLNILQFNQVKVLNNKAEFMSSRHLKVGDTLEIKYRDELISQNIIEIRVIDSKVEKSLLGIILVANGKRYTSIEEIRRNNDRGLSYYLFEKDDYGGSSNMTNISMFETKSDISYQEYYFHYGYELNFYFDRLKVKNDVAIGLVYSTGIEYVETVEKTNLYSFTRSYTGEIDYKPDTPYSLHSIDVSYKVNFIETSSFDFIDVYEYDINHDLIHTSTLTYDDFFGFQAHENAIYSYIKVTSANDFYYYREVYQLKIGEKIDLHRSDEYGFVYKTKFDYLSYSPRSLHVN